MFLTMSQLGDTLKGVVEISQGRVRVLHEKQVRGPLCTQLLETATQHEQIELRGMSRWLLKMLAQEFGIYLQAHEPQSLLPMIRIQKINHEIARAIFVSANRQNISAFIIEAASPATTASFSAVFITAAIQAAYQGTLFFKEVAPERKGFVVGERAGPSETLETDLDQYFKLFKQNSDIQPLLKTTKIKFSLKDEIALAGLESKQKQHHILFSS